MPSRRAVLVTLVALIIGIDVAVLAWRWRPMRVVDWLHTDANDWVTPTHDDAGTRYAPSAELTPANAYCLTLLSGGEVLTSQVPE